jgi:hypothetical protein
MRDFNYRALYVGVSRHEEGNVPLKPFRSECFVDAVSAFLSNMRRVATFAAMPAELSYNVRRDQLLSDCATIETTGKLKPDLRQFLDNDPSPEFRASFQKFATEYITEKSFEEKRDTTERLGVGYIERVLDAEFPPMQASMDAVFEAVILQSWTAFETLAADLWFTALDNGPSQWRTNVLRKHGEFKRGSNWEPQTVLPAVLNDPQKKFGSSLKDLDAIGFQKFRLLKFWYETAFGVGVAKIFAEDGGYIRALAAVRNLIVHQAGKADATYVNEVKKFPELNQVAEDNLIQLDGVTVNKLRKTAIKVGIALIQHLDDALSSYSTAT